MKSWDFVVWGFNSENCLSLSYGMLSNLLITIFGCDVVIVQDKNLWLLSMFHSDIYLGHINKLIEMKFSPNNRSIFGQQRHLFGDWRVLTPLLIELYKTCSSFSKFDWVYRFKAVGCHANTLRACHDWIREQLDQLSHAPTFCGDLSLSE